MNFSRIQEIEKLYRTQKTNKFNFLPFSFTDKASKVQLNGLVCRPQSMYNTYFYTEETSKEKIALHFTAGHLQGDLGALSRKDYHVSVPFVIARDGTIYQMHHSKYWSYHLGRNALGGNKTQSQKTIGIEISNYGPLTLRDGNLETAYSRPKSNPTRVDIYCKESDTDKYYKLVNPYSCLLYTSPSPRDATLSRMPSSA